jgi:two-component system, OmpR family, sensor kinase
VPLRLRIAAAVAIAMTIVLVAVGWLLYARERAALEGGLDDELQARVDAVAPYIHRNPRLARIPEALRLDPEEGFIQVLTPRGAVVDTFPEVHRNTLRLSSADLREARGDGLETTRMLTGIGTTRVVVSPLERGQRHYLLVAAASFSDIDEALSSLTRVLLVVLPIGIAGTTLVGWLLAGLALRPVERMRRETEDIAQEELGRRLQVPTTGDELARLATTMNSMLDRVESAVEHERRLVDLTSHELRTPLGVARAEASLALARRRSRAELEEGMQVVARQLDWMSRLSDDLLVLARSQRGQVPVRRTPVDLRAVLEGCCEAWLARAAARGIGLTLTAADGVVVEVDPDRLGQAVGNLLDNALRHTPAGGSVHIVATVDGPQLRVVVEDSGPGFDAGVLADAFQPYVRGNGDATGSGAGLGLAIVQAVAESHGGGATAENLPGGGARVTTVTMLARPPAVPAG